MLELQLLILLALGMVVDPAHRPAALVKTDIVETLETCSRDGFDAVVGHEEVLFPAHEEVLSLLVIFQREIRGGGGGRVRGWSCCGFVRGGCCSCGAFGQGSPGGEAGPVLQVDFLAAPPGGVGGFEEVLGADYLAFEESGEGGVVVGEALDAEVA